MFNEYSIENCYWAGFIAADGYIRPNRATTHIKLSLKDINHLKKFEKFSNYKGKVKTYNNYCSIDISGKETKNNLNKLFKITPAKTKTLIFPDIPEKYISHFVRGYFDGDGCITWTTCSVIAITCASPEFLNKIKNIFFDLGVRLKSKNDMPPTTSVYQISYSGKNAKIIADWMYKDSIESLRLDRKFEKYVKQFKPD